MAAVGRTRLVSLLVIASLALVVALACQPREPAAQIDSGIVAPTHTEASPAERPGQTLAGTTSPTLSTVDRVSAAGEGEQVSQLPIDDVSPQPSQATPSDGWVAQSLLPVAPSESKEEPKRVRPRVPVIALDPGHGGPESGASAGDFAEKTVNLRIALKLSDLLRDFGYEVVLTRDADRAVDPGYTGGGSYPGVSSDLQGRIDIANEAKADLFISIHNNGSADPDQSGTEVWYDSLRSFGDRNLALARLAQAGLVERIRALGYRVYDRGIKDDVNFRIFRGRAYQIYVLSPGDGARPHVPTMMPGVLGESLFLSNAGDAAMLRKESTLEAIAAGYRDAIVAYFDLYPFDESAEAAD